MPNPNATTSAGAIATTGVTLRITANGMTPARGSATRPPARRARPPPTVPITRPTSASCSVVPAFSGRSSGPRGTAAPRSTTSAGGRGSPARPSSRAARRRPAPAPSGARTRGCRILTRRPAEGSRGVPARLSRTCADEVFVLVHAGGVEQPVVAGPGQPDVDDARDAPGPGGHHDDGVGEHDGLGDGVGDEDDRRAHSCHRSSSCTWAASRVNSSRAENGSSISRTSGWRAKARAMAAAAACPPRARGVCGPGRHRGRGG